MSFSVTIDAFEGPLDLMLYLIREKKLDLFDLDIFELTTQYVAYIHQMQKNELEIAAEYLSELAGLIEYKSKRLLPRDESIFDAEDPEQDADNLVRRLLEYKQFKNISMELSERFNQRQSEIDIPSTYHSMMNDVDQSFEIKNDIYDLIKAMSKLLIRSHQTNQSLEVKVTNMELSVDERIDQIRLYLEHQKSTFNLKDLMNEAQTLEIQIVTFLAVLDMIRMSELVYTMSDDQQILLKGGQA